MSELLLLLLRLLPYHAYTIAIVVCTYDFVSVFENSWDEEDEKKTIYCTKTIPNANKPNNLKRKWRNTRKIGMCTGKHMQTHIQCLNEVESAFDVYNNLRQINSKYEQIYRCSIVFHGNWFFFYYISNRKQM